MTYVDTSALVALFTGESRGEALLRWLARRPSAECCISDWTITEFASALAIKVRRGELGDDNLAQAWLEFDGACDTLLKVERLEAGDFGNAAALRRCAWSRQAACAAAIRCTSRSHRAWPARP